MSWIRTIPRRCQLIGVFIAAGWHASYRGRIRGLVRALRETACAYRQGGLPAFERALSAVTPETISPSEVDFSLKLADALAAVLRIRPFRYCMRRSVLRFEILRAAGRAPVFVIGAEHVATAQKLDGHAWVELDGHAFSEEDDRPQRMVTTYRYPR